LLIERAAITHTPTAATLLRSIPTSAWLPPWRVQLRGFADPISGAQAGDADPAHRRLTGTAEEVSAVAGELGGLAELHVGRGNRKIFLGASARTPVIHLATHAVADASTMEQSRIMFSSADESVPGADFLFLNEAYALKLDDVDLVVLSACDTERGRLLRGEGVQSFSRAFLAAGARSSVTTMWRVADEPTVDFMRVFYHHLGRGVPRDEALRRAKLRFLNERSAVADPHYWAAFVLTGDGTRPLPRAVTWRALAGAFSAIGLLTVVGVHFYRQKKSVPH
jgi:CHAT domain-containing protein